MPIAVLAPEVVAQIAAGEVIERPASVVKELVENSIDAGAGFIKVEVREGGRRLIRVSDDGAGIPSSEAELAFARHATSKLAHLSDLAAIRSLGFRGEALPSIAAVADAEVLTRAIGEELGTYLRLEKGQVALKEARAAPQGTRITVEWLFRRVPARRKFLRAVATELAYIADLVASYALAYPSIRLELVSEGRGLLASPGGGKLLEVLATIYGREVAREMLPLGGSAGRYIREGLEVRGYISQPNLHRASRKYLTLLVNGRWVQDRTLLRAVEAPYEGSLPRGRFPIAVVEVRLDPSQVDVNVHPAKREVRFQEPAQVFSVVERAVREALVGGGLGREAPGEEGRRSLPPEVARWERGRLALEVQRTGEAAPQAAMSLPEGKLPILRVMGQVAGSYIVAEGPEGLYMLDQHAAHERILYESFRAQKGRGQAASQVLLEPMVLELSPADAVVLGDRKGYLEALGFQVEDFGGRMWRVSSVPVAFQGVDLREAIPAVLAEQRALGDSPDWEGELLVSLACHGAVKAGKLLSIPEMQALVRSLEAAQMPLTCPHGRPTVVRFSMEELAREFSRR